MAGRIVRQNSQKTIDSQISSNPNIGKIVRKSSALKPKQSSLLDKANLKVK